MHMKYAHPLCVNQGVLGNPRAAEAAPTFLPLGFSVSGTTRHGWLHPTFQGRPEWVSGGAFGPEASIFGAVAVLLGSYLLWAWKGQPALPPHSNGKGASWQSGCI